mmetsp:Transcript_33664/g.108197  ORF Transcript_33664/g.108197 Transcript_33664/m.108197 type:complete len:255 (+) Transcript_33664:1079-1843(+)
MVEGGCGGDCVTPTTVEGGCGGGWAGGGESKLALERTRTRRVSVCVGGVTVAPTRHRHNRPSAPRCTRLVGESCWRGRTRVSDGQVARPLAPVAREPPGGAQRGAARRHADTSSLRVVGHDGEPRALRRRDRGRDPGDARGGRGASCKLRRHRRREEDCARVARGRQSLPRTVRETGGRGGGRHRAVSRAAKHERPARQGRLEGRAGPHLLLRGRRAGQHMTARAYGVYATGARSRALLPLDSTHCYLHAHVHS